MTVVTLHESPQGRLYLHMDGEETGWRLNGRTASTFLTDALLVANNDTAAHPSIFSTAVTWATMHVCDSDETSTDDDSVRPVAILKLDLNMSPQAAAYTLFFPQ